LVIIVVFPLVFGSEREVFLFFLRFWDGLLWRRRWEQETKIVVVVVFNFRFWRRGRRWKNL
jgi:hypothetical protein